MSSNNSRTSDDQRIVSSADLLKRGATLLREACPRCGGVQVRFKGNIYCLKEDDLSELLSTGTTQNNQTGTPSSGTTLKPQAESAKEEPKKSAGSDQVRNILEEKLKKLSKELEESDDIEKQTKLLELISKYVDTLNKLS